MIRHGLIGLLLLLSCAVAHAASQRTFGPITLQTGPFTIANLKIPIKRGPVTLVIVPSTFGDSGQGLSYQWEFSRDKGLTWSVWTGATMTGGTHLDRQGQPLTEFPAQVRTRMEGDIRMRLTGEVTNGPMDVTIRVEVP
jgi:hypothetical protein